MVHFNTNRKSLIAALFVTALLGSVGALTIAPSASAQGEIGCGTSTLEHTELLEGVTLVGNDGRSNAVKTIELPAPLAPGEYLIRAVSSDDHRAESLDEPAEQFYAVIARKRTEPIADLPPEADFVGSVVANIDPENPQLLPAKVLPGATLGVIEVAGGETVLNLVHVGRGNDAEANSISPRLVSIACAVTGLELSTDLGTTGVAADGTATVRMQISNTTAADAAGVKLQSVLPAGIERDGDLVASFGVASVVGSSIRWEGDIKAGATAVIDVPIITDLAGIERCGDDAVGQSGHCEVSAQLVGATGGVPVTPIALVEIAAVADLELAMTYQPRVGSTTSLTGTFTIVVTNQPGSHLSATADEIVVSTALHDSLALAPGDLASTTGTVIIEGGQISWAVGSLVPGASSTLSFGVALPSIGSYPAAASVASSATKDLDSTAGEPSSPAEDDEATANAVGEFVSTTTRTPRTTTTTVVPATVKPADAEPDSDNADGGEKTGFRLVLPDGVDTSPPAPPELSVDDQTEVAGAVQERPETAATIPIRSESKLPLAISIALSLLLLSAAAVYMYRTQESELNSFH